MGSQDTLPAVNIVTREEFAAFVKMCETLRGEDKKAVNERIDEVDRARKEYESKCEEDRRILRGEVVKATDLIKVVDGKMDAQNVVMADHIKNVNEQLAAFKKVNDKLDKIFSSILADPRIGSLLKACIMGTLYLIFRYLESRGYVNVP